MVTQEKKKREGGKYLVSRGDDEQRRKLLRNIAKGTKDPMIEFILTK